jgi:hypothetical protein
VKQWGTTAALINGDSGAEKLLASFADELSCEAKAWAWAIPGRTVSYTPDEFHEKVVVPADRFALQSEREAAYLTARLAAGGESEFEPPASAVGAESVPVARRSGLKTGFQVTERDGVSNLPAKRVSVVVALWCDWLKLDEG